MLADGAPKSDDLRCATMMVPPRASSLDFREKSIGEPVRGTEVKKDPSFSDASWNEPGLDEALERMEDA